MHYVKVHDVNASSVAGGFGVSGERMKEIAETFQKTMQDPALRTWLLRIDKTSELCGIKSGEEMALLMFMVGQGIGTMNTQEEAGEKIMKVVDVVVLMSHYIESKGWEEEVKDLAGTIAKTGVPVEIAQEIAQAKATSGKLKEAMKEAK